MRAFATDRYGAVADLSLRDLPAPAPSAGEVLVRVEAAGLNPADLKVLSGREGGRFLHASKFPLVLGFDLCGTVAALGPGVDALAEGDRVFGFLAYTRGTTQGTCAELVTAPSDTLAKVPEGVTAEQAAALATAGCTALQMLRDKAGLDLSGPETAKGKTILVNGASGGVGAFAVQLAAASGARVWGTCSATKADYVRSLGAHEVVDYRRTSVEAIDGRFHAFIDAAATSSFMAARARLEPGGAYVTTLPSLSLLTGTVASLLTRKKCRFVVVGSRPEDLADLARRVADGGLQVKVDACVPLAELPAALARLGSGEALGKVVVRVPD